MSKRKTTWQLSQDGATLGKMVDLIAGLGPDEDGHAAMTETLAERLAEYGDEVGDKFLALDFAEAHLKREADGYREQADAFKSAISRAKAGCVRVKALKVGLLQAHKQATGDMRLDLPDGSKASLVQRECKPKAVWSKELSAALPASVWRKVEVAEVDKDALLEHLIASGDILDECGQVVAELEWVDPTHTRRTK